MALLKQLDALDEGGRITAEGRALAKLPLHPRLAHMIQRAEDKGTAAELAVLLTERGLGGDDTDLAHRLSRFRADRSRRANDARSLARRWGGAPGDDLDIGRNLARAFPDRVAQAAGARGRYRLANGRGATLEESDALARQSVPCRHRDHRRGRNGTDTIGRSAHARRYRGAVRRAHRHRDDPAVGQREQLRSCTAPPDLSGAGARRRSYCTQRSGGSGTPSRRARDRSSAVVQGAADTDLPRKIPPLGLCHLHGRSRDPPRWTHVPRRDHRRRSRPAAPLRTPRRDRPCAAVAFRSTNGQPRPHRLCCRSRSEHRTARAGTLRPRPPSDRRQWPHSADAGAAQSRHTGRSRSRAICRASGAARGRMWPRTCAAAIRGIYGPTIRRARSQRRGPSREAPRPSSARSRPSAIPTSASRHARACAPPTCGPRQAT